MPRSNKLAVTELMTELVKEEGWRSTPYRCTSGALTIGVGHNLDAAGLCDAAILAQLSHDVGEAIEAAEAVCASYGIDWDFMPIAGRRALALMVFQLGRDGLLGFKKMLAALQTRDWNKARIEAADSDWAKQTPRRAMIVDNLMQLAKIDADAGSL